MSDAFSETEHAPPRDDPTSGHPFPQRRRSSWTDLSGPWGFAYDDDDAGRAERWCERDIAESTITVPYPPESSASGVGDTAYHRVMWYSRRLGRDVLESAGLGGQGERLLLHFGAVDYTATVWVNGAPAGSHSGGHTPFTLDITELLVGDDDLLVVRVEDDPHDVGQPRGKQDWLLQPRDIWYHRTSGIWQRVWLEAVPLGHIEDAAWLVSRNCDEVTLELTLSRPLGPDSEVHVRLEHEGVRIAEQTALVGETATPTTKLALRGQLNGQHYDKLLWSPETPRLIDALVTVSRDAWSDSVQSYLGLRSVGTQAGRFTLNDRPYAVRAVLEQGYWPDTHLAAPDDDALRAEVELIKALGFNTARIHQKIEDPRFLYWADRLGLLVWGEAPAAYEFTHAAMTRLTNEWIEAVRRDRSHPCLVTWVPVNESWGVQHVSHEPAQRAFTRALADLTRALDPSRPVISNDGWEHTSSDLLTVHDYDAHAGDIRQRYASREALEELFAGFGHAGRLLMAEGSADLSLPVMVSEFGGIRFVSEGSGAVDATSWGYSTATDRADFERRLAECFAAFQSSPHLAGWCYTQLTDTMQEANGLTDEHRRPKLDVDKIRSIVLGERSQPQ